MNPAINLYTSASGRGLGEARRGDALREASLRAAARRGEREEREEARRVMPHHTLPTDPTDPLEGGDVARHNRKHTEREREMEMHRCDAEMARCGAGATLRAMPWS